MNAPMTISSLQCPECSASNTIRYGTRNGHQIYYCKPCKKRFTDNGATPGRRVPPDQVGAAVALFYDGLSLEDVRRNFGQLYDFQPSTGSVYEWIRDYSQLAAEKMKAAPPKNLGDTWVADEMVVRVGGQKLWVWTVMDADTRFILATHLSRVRTTSDAETLFREAKATAGGRSPRRIITDGLAAYVEGSERVFGGETRHVVSGGLRSETNNNLIERLNGTIRERTKVMRGMKSKASAEAVVEGWNLHYNYFRPHESLHGNTPAGATGAETPLRNWEDVARLDVRPISHARSRMETQRRMTTALEAKEDMRRLVAEKRQGVGPRRLVIERRAVIERPRIPARRLLA